MFFVDTNIFIRYLTKDDPSKAKACYRLFERAKQNKVTLTTSESVIAEVVFILSSKKLYGLSREAVRVRLYPLLALQNLRLSHKRSYFRALDLYGSQSIDLEDALTVATMERRRLKRLYSYDQDFDRIQETAIQRIEP